MISRTLPPLPTVPNNGRGHIVADIPYTGPVTVATHLGNIPSDYHSYSSSIQQPYVSCGNGACAISGSEVWRPQPVVNEDGTVQTAPQTAHIDARPASVIGHAILGGVIGGFIGGFAGVVASIFTGVAAPAVIGASAGAAIGAFIQGTAAHDDRIRLEWQEIPTERQSLAGYSETVRERTEEVCHTDGHGHRHCHEENDGWYHEFHADVRGTVLGSSWQPVVVHYSQHEHKP